MTNQPDIKPTEGGSPGSNLLAYRRCLGQFATGVTVVTARDGDQLVGMTANSFSSVSLEPPLVLWSVKRGSPSYEAFAGASNFAINILSREQTHISNHFGKSGAEKFRDVPWLPGEAGVPLLKGVISTLECQRVNRVDGGDHLIIIGEVLRFARYNREPLLFVQGHYGSAADYPDPNGETTFYRKPSNGPMNEFMTSLAYRAFGVLSDALERDRQTEGLTLPQTRLMTAIDSMPGSTITELLPALHLGHNIARFIVEELRTSGFIAVDGKGRFSLTPLGAERNGALLSRARSTEAAILFLLPENDVSAARRVLAAIASLENLKGNASSGASDPSEPIAV